MSLCSKYKGINTANVAQNTTNYSNYVTQKQSAYDSWINEFNAYDATCVISNPGGDYDKLFSANGLKNKYYAIKEPVLLNIYDISKCNDPSDIYFDSNNVINVQSNVNYPNYVIYNGIAFSNPVTIGSYKYDNTSGIENFCSSRCADIDNCIAFSINNGVNTNNCTLYSNYSNDLAGKSFNIKPDSKLFLQKKAVVHTHGNSLINTIGVAIGCVILLCILIIGIVLIVEKIKSRRS